MFRRHRVALSLTVLLSAALPACQSCVEVEFRQLALTPTPLLCTPAEARCEGTARQVCSDDGSSWEDDPCEPTRPYCSGAGECICIDDADDDVCTLDHCENGNLVVEPAAPPGFPCDLWQGTSLETACARDAAGGVRCWGGNALGELGRGSMDDEPHPTPLAVPIPPVRSLALGYQFACALLRDGTVDCWGNNDSGQTGGDAGDPVLSPRPVPLPNLARRVATGAWHACALLVDTSVVCWGKNADGQLGDGTQTDRATPAPLLAHGTTPLKSVVDLALGFNFSCALLAGGDLWCWGEGTVVGDGGPVDEPRLYPVWILGGVKQVSAGSNHTCALKDNGEVWCWGLSADGETGDPTPTGGLNKDVTTLPRRLDGAAGSLFVSASYRHSCATHPGGVWCWGGDFWGQLGDGGSCTESMCTHYPEPDPQPVQGLDPVDQLATGYFHSCVIANGAPSCWGPNDAGQLGDGTTNGADQPTQVLWQ